MRFSFRIGAKLALAAALPLAVLIGLASYDLLAKWETRSQMAALGRLGDAVAGISQLVHELQRERGASAVFVGSKGAQLRAELPEQRKLADKQRQAAAASFDELHASVSAESFRQALENARKAVAELDGKRQAIDAFAITAPESNTYFTDTIAKLLGVVGELAKVSTRSDVTTSIAAYLNFMHGKERSGQERATGAAGIATGRFDLALYRRVLGLAAVQQAYFDLFEASATESERAFFKSTLSGPVTDDVVKMRETIAKGGLSGELQGLDGKTWFTATTARIDKLKLVEDRIATDLKQQTDAIYAEATNGLMTLATTMLISLLVCFGCVAGISRSIVRPIARLVGALKELAAGNFDMVLPGLGRRDEIGDLAQAVEGIKSKAIEKARHEAEQEEARAQAAEAERKAAMRRMADDFESAVGSIVETVSSASGELESAARTLTQTAETTQQLSSKVASASTEASSNVE
ncbi:MAG: nitrate- and nitrite sensing domain-containing protein, partial [Alphaproteobacteria bacterium]|nr:nitrate- and nitrite sensing domain-containing protein [Alphaproteobacteria bacterium]